MSKNIESKNTGASRYLSLFLAALLSVGLWSCGLFDGDDPSGEDPPANTDELSQLLGGGNDGNGGGGGNGDNGGEPLVFRGADLSDQKAMRFEVSKDGKDDKDQVKYKVTLKGEGKDGTHVLKKSEKEGSNKYTYDAYDETGENYLGSYTIERDVMTAQLKLNDARAVFLGQRNKEIALNGRYVALTILKTATGETPFEAGMDFARIDRNVLYFYSGEKDPFSLPYGEIYRKTNMTPKVKFTPYDGGDRIGMTFNYKLDEDFEEKRKLFQRIEGWFLGPEGTDFRRFLEDPTHLFTQEQKDNFLNLKANADHWGVHIDLGANVEQMSQKVKARVNEFLAKLRQPERHKFDDVTNDFGGEARTQGSFGGGLRQLLDFVLLISDNQGSNEALKSVLNGFFEKLVKERVATENNTFTFEGFVASEGLLIVPPFERYGLRVPEISFFVKMSDELTLGEGTYRASNSDIFSDEYLEMKVSSSTVSAKVMPDGYNFLPSEANYVETENAPSSFKLYIGDNLRVVTFSLTENSLYYYIETTKVEDGIGTTHYSYGVGVRE